MIRKLLSKISKGIRASFDGATRGKRSGAMHQETNDVGEAIGNDLEALRERSAGAYLNSPMAHSSFEQWVSDEIGSTARITAISSNADANKKLNELWSRHTRFLVASEEMPMIGWLSMITRERRVHGEVFIRKVKRKLGLYPAPFQIQIIKSHMCPLIDRTLDNGNVIKQGIEFRNNKKVAVWFQKKEDNHHDLYRVPIKDVIHAYIPKFAGQIRGIPSFAASILKEAEYNNYEENELNRKSSQSSVVGMLKRSAAEMDPDDLGGGYDPDGETEPEEIDPSYLKLGPNELLIGEDGESLDLNFSQDVGQSYKDFTSNNQTLVSMGGGLPVQLVTSKFDGVNDRTLRQINNNHRRKVKAEKLISTDFQVVGKIWRWFVDSAVLAGVDLPNYYENRDDYRKYRFATEAFAYDHAVQDLQAAEKSIALGVSSEISFNEERGGDFEQNIQDKVEYIAKVKMYCEKAGIKPEEFYKRG